MERGEESLREDLSQVRRWGQRLSLAARYEMSLQNKVRGSGSANDQRMPPFVQLTRLDSTPNQPHPSSCLCFEGEKALTGGFLIVLPP